MLDIREQLVAAVGELARLARAIRVDQYSASTPCSDFDVAALCAHLMQEVVLHGWDLAVATGQTPRFSEEVAGTVLRWLESDQDSLRSDTWYQPPVHTASRSLLDQAVARSGRNPTRRTVAPGSPATA